MYLFLNETGTVLLARRSIVLEHSTRTTLNKNEKRFGQALAGIKMSWSFLRG